MLYNIIINHELGVTQMETKTIAYVNTYDRNTKRGIAKTYELKFTDGTKLDCAFKDPGVAVGDTISFESEPGYMGKPKLVGAVTRTSSDPVNPPPAATGKSFGGGGRVFPVPVMHGDRSIVRQNALAHASKVWAAGVKAQWAFDDPANVAACADQIIALAAAFERYSCGDIEAEAAEAIGADE